MYAGEIGAGHVQPQRHRAGGKHQAGKPDALFIRDLEFAAADIDLGGDATIFQGDAAVAPPGSRPELDIVRRRLARQHRRQQHAVIGKPRLVADHGDGVATECALGQFLDQTRRGHAIADDDERLAHRFPSKLQKSARRCARPRRARSSRRWRLPIAIVIDGDVAQAISSSVPPGPGGLSPYISVAWR
jgi:hypothetical protein